MGERILLVATVQSHVAQFHNNTIKALRQRGDIVDVAAGNNLSEKDILCITCANEIFDLPFARSPFAFSNIIAYKKLKQLLKNGKYDIVYCHTPVGAVLSRLAAKRYRRSGLKIIYMAHGFHFFKGSSKKNWLMYYPIEKILSKYTDTLITINQEDYEFAKRKLKAKRIEYVPGVGIDYTRLLCDEDRDQIRKDLGYSKNDFVIFSVGELNNNKNNIKVIDAISILNNKDIKYMLAGNGPLRKQLEEKIKVAGMESRVKFLGYIRNIGRYYKAADLFVLPSLREGLPCAVMEAMSVGLPVVCSDIRGCRDLIENEKGGFLCNPTRAEEFATAIEKIMLDKNKSFGEFNQRKSTTYSADSVTQEILNILNKG